MQFGPRFQLVGMFGLQTMHRIRTSMTFTRQVPDHINSVTASNESYVKGVSSYSPPDL